MASRHADWIRQARKDLDHARHSLESSDYEWCPSVKVSFVDREDVIAGVRRAVERLARERPEVEEVLLFGSYARGDCVPSSDADLLVVLSDSEETRPADRVPDYQLLDAPVPVDVLPLTVAEVKQRIEASDRFLASVMAEARPIFRR